MHRPATARRRQNGSARRNKFESPQTRQLVELSGSVGDHAAWKLATAHVILRRWGSHSATIVIDSENIHAGTGLSGIILEPDRDKAEAAAKEAIERLRRMPPSIRVERSAGAVGHNDAAGQAGS